MFTLEKRPTPSRFWQGATPVLAVLLTMIAGGVMFAILGRLVPQISAYFVSAPFIALGGVVLFYLAVGEMIRVLVVSFRVDVIR